MHNEKELKTKAEKARHKKAAVGDDVDLDLFEDAPVPHPQLAETDLCSLPPDEQQRLLMAGMDFSGSKRGGTYIQKDATVVHCQTRQEDIEVMPIRRALEDYDWVRDYYWQIVPVDTDKFTAAAHLGLHDGYVIRSKPGTRSIYPVQTCLYMNTEGLQQNVHNIIIAEEDSELHVISGCVTSPGLKRGLHVGVSEFYVKRNAKLTFTMIHNWAEDMIVRPRSAGRIEAGGLFVSNYICLRPVRSLQMYPAAFLAGEDSVARFYSILVGSPGSVLDVGGRTHLDAAGCRAEIVSRAISNGGMIAARGRLVGSVPGIKAHLECRGLILNGGTIHAIPELEGLVEGVEMSHEAAVGKIAQEEIAYLMSRGLREDEAVSTIVRGFLHIDMPDLPHQLTAEIDRAIGNSDRDML